MSDAKQTRLGRDEKKALANAADGSIKHPFVQEIMDEFALNMGFRREGLPAYGLNKVARYAAIVARCEALGIDPEAMAMDDGEEAEFARMVIDAAVDAGKPVFVVVANGEGGTDR